MASSARVCRYAAYPTYCARRYFSFAARYNGRARLLARNEDVTGALTAENGLLFVLSKIFWALARPDLLLPVVIVIGLALTALRWTRTGWWIAAIRASVLLAVALLPTDDWLMARLENRFPPP